MDYCTSRSRAEVLLRELADDAFLAARVRQQGNNVSLSTQLLLPAKQIVYYNKFLQVCVQIMKYVIDYSKCVNMLCGVSVTTSGLSDNLTTTVHVLDTDMLVVVVDV